MTLGEALVEYQQVARVRAAQFDEPYSKAAIEGTVDGVLLSVELMLRRYGVWDLEEPVREEEG